MTANCGHATKILKLIAWGWESPLTAAMTKKFAIEGSESLAPDIQQWSEMAYLCLVGIQICSAKKS